jgi:hypothetical protein
MMEAAVLLQMQKNNFLELYAILLLQEYYTLEGQYYKLDLASGEAG